MTGKVSTINTTTWGIDYAVAVNEIYPRRRSTLLRLRKEQTQWIVVICALSIAS